MAQDDLALDILTDLWIWNLVTIRVMFQGKLRVSISGNAFYKALSKTDLQVKY